jgi:DNA (cytosine-5)-methyltransferase 1
MGKMNELHLFAGAGGGILGGQLLGHRPICAVELEPYAQACLVARQNDGSFPPFPIWDDVRTFDGKPWKGVADVVCGGFPCQDISAAGKGAGLNGERSGLWSEMARIIGEVRPKAAFIENSPMLVTRGLSTVLADLAGMGFDVRWMCLSAADCGAWHERNRIWILASNSEYDWFGWRKQQPKSKQEKNAAYNSEARLAPCSIQAFKPKIKSLGVKSWGGFSGIDGIEKVVEKFCRVDDGMAYRSHSIAAIGNGQVPIVAATAWRMLSSK